MAVILTTQIQECFPVDTTTQRAKEGIAGLGLGSSRSFIFIIAAFESALFLRTEAGMGNA